MKSMRVFVASVAVAVSVGCAPESDVRDIALRIGGTTTVMLPVTAGTGYGWSVDAARSSGMECLVVTPGATKFPSGRVGGAGEQEWHVEGHAAGQADLTFVYQRPWEPVAPAARSTEIHVSVQ